MENGYNKTVVACFVGYIVQAIVNNFAPLLFVTFQQSYHVSLIQIALVVSLNFGVQLLVDIVSISFVDRIGYRASMVLAHLFAAIGLIMLAILPELLPNPFTGILIAVVIYAIGGGLLEVLVSPVVEACPTDNKEKAMSMLHSFYCWGLAGVVALSTLFFHFVGIQHWKILAMLWAIVPLANAFVFTRVPIAPLIKEGQHGLSIGQLLSSKLFWVLFAMMVCAGASEQAVCQWSSAFAEKGLGVAKTMGDLAGPMAFALLMGTSRFIYGKFGDRMDLGKFMAISCIVCIVAYLGVSLSPVPQLGLAACALCGLSVGIMWPGTFSRAAAALPRGGTALFALLALGGDLGCAGGPALVGVVSGMAGDSLQAGLLAGIVFPIVLLAGVLLCQKGRLR